MSTAANDRTGTGPNKLKKKPDDVWGCYCDDKICKGPGRCDKQDILQKVSKKTNGGLRTNASLAVFSILKEVTAGPGIAVPGLRASAGGALYILETLAKMHDNKAIFSDLLEKTVDYIMFVVRLTEKLQAMGKEPSEDFQAELDAFAEKFQETKQWLIKIQGRGRFVRFIQAHGDKNAIDQIKQDLLHRTQRFQTFMIADMYLGLNKTAVLSEEEIRAQSEEMIMEKCNDLRTAYYAPQTNNVTVTHSAPANLGNAASSTAPINLSNSAGAVVSNSGNSHFENRQNYNNDNRVMTYNNQYAPPTQALALPA